MNKEYQLIKERITSNNVVYSERYGDLQGLIYIPKIEFGGATVYPDKLIMTLRTATD